MSATNDDALAQSLTDAVLNFGTAYAATQESLQLITVNILEMQGQLQMLCQAVGISQPLRQQPQCPQGGRSQGQQRGGHNSGGNSGGGGGGGGGGGYNIGGGSYNGGGGGSNANGGDSGNGNSNGGGNRSRSAAAILDIRPQAPPPSPVKRFENWNYCFTHGGNMDNNHASALCARPGEIHQRASTRTSTMGSTMHYMNKTVLPSNIGRCAAPTRPPPHPLKNYTPTNSFPMVTNRPQFPTGCTQQLRFWTPHWSLPASQQHSPPPTRYCNDAQYNGIQQHISACISPPQGAPAPANQGWYNNF